VCLYAGGAAGDWSIIIETVDATESQIANFHFTHGVGKSSTVYIWKSNETNWFVYQGQTKIGSNNILTISLDSDAIYSLTTTTGQGLVKPGVIPASAPFPYPYSDNFESYQPENTVRYFADEGGSWNAANSPPGSSSLMSFKQVVTQHPISWLSVEPPPLTILGNSQLWTDYNVTVDVYVPSETLNIDGYVALFSRIETYDTFDNSWPPGYALLLYPTNSTYQIVKGSEKNNVWKQIIKQGNVMLKTNQWHTLSWVCKGNNLLGYLDGGSITGGIPVQDSQFTNGMIGLGTGYNQAYFDNFVVSPL